MYLSNINTFLNGGVSQNRSPFAGSLALFAPAEKGQTTLQNLSNQILTGQKNSEQTKDLSEIAQRRKDAYIPKSSSDDDPMDDIATELLELCMGQLQIQLRGLEGYRRELTDFRDQLQKMDHTIQGYQDIIDGKTPLQEGYDMQSVQNSCALAKMQRQQFFEYGMTFYNKERLYSYKDYARENGINENRIKTPMSEYLGGWCSDWGIDPNSSDIYSDIDRILADIEDQAEVTSQGISHIYGLLYKRGHGEKYKSCLDAPADPRPTLTAQIIAAWKRETEQLKTNLQAL